MQWLNYLDDCKSCQIHGFADASERACAAATYLQLEKIYGQIYVTLISSKNRLALTKIISLPRLELCATLFLVKLMNKVEKSLKLKHVDKFAWSDSEIVLAWSLLHIVCQPFMTGDMFDLILIQLTAQLAVSRLHN